MTRDQQEHDRDRRDLTILQMLDRGVAIATVATLMQVSVEYVTELQNEAAITS